MINNPAKAEKQNNAEKKEDLKKLYAQLYNNPIVSSSSIVLSMHKEQNTGIMQVIDDMMDQISEFRGKNITRIETILLAQVHALQAMFERAAIQVGNPASIEALQAWGVIALKAQEQTRKTLATLMDIKNPKPTAFIKQQNNAVNQQINNQPESSKNPEQTNTENELLCEASYEALDDRRTQTPIKLDFQMATLETVYRSQDRSRESGK